MKRIIKILAAVMSLVMLTACAKKEALPKDSFTRDAFRNTFANYRYFDDEATWMEYFYTEVQPGVELKTLFDDGVMMSAGYEVFDDNALLKSEVHAYLVSADDLNGGENFYEHGETYLFKTHPGLVVDFEGEGDVICRYMTCNSDDFYGGYYWYDNTIIAVYAYATEDYPVIDDVSRAEVDRSLESLGLPLPTDAN